MSSIFSKIDNARIRRRIVLLIAVLVAVPLMLMGWVRTPWITGLHRAPAQPVLFDHRHHVVDDGIDCRYCHSLVERSTYAGVPPTATCMGCHAQIWNDSPLLEPVRRSFFLDQPIRWRRVYRLPDFVYFDHAPHVAKGVGCESCHGRVDEMARVEQAVPLTMGWCLECHRNPVPHLRPLDRITAMGWQPDAPRVELGRALMAKYDVYPPTDCTTCHR